MKKQRKENNDKVNIFKVLAKGLIISILLTIVCVELAILLIVWTVGGIEAFIALNLHQEKTAIIVFLVICFFALFIIGVPTFFEIMRNEKGKISKKLAEEILSKDVYTEVYPKEGHLYYQNFFYRGLPDKAKYFSILSKDEKEIVIVLKFDKYDGYVFLERIKKENFKDAYEVVQTMELTEKVI